MKKIPTYLIHGSLGSGKTTLLNKLIRSGVFKNAVVIENEYANYNFDKDIIEGEIKIFDVSGGCICCSSGQELFEALKAISSRKQVDNLFIETTGVASSVELIKQLMLSSEFDEQYSLVRNIFVIDLLEDNLDLIKKEKMLDIAMADIVILNKADLAPKNKVKDFEDFIRTVSDAMISVTTRGNIDANLVYSISKSMADTVLLRNISNLAKDATDHLKNVLYQVIYPTKKISEEMLISFLRLKNKGSDMDILRVKGILTDIDGKKFSISATKNNSEVSPIINPNKNNDVLVLIGKNVTKDNLKDITSLLC